MRRNILIPVAIFALVIVLLSAFKSDRRVRFRKYSWADIGRSAKAHDKMIFVLVTGKYCPTSKKMHKVLTDPSVCEYYNKSFVNTIFDAQNPTQYYRASNWGVSSIPALIYLNQNREVVHLTQGYYDAKGMIAEAQIALEIVRKEKAKNKPTSSQK